MISTVALHLLLMTRHQMKLGAVVAVVAIAGVLLAWIVVRTMRRPKVEEASAPPPFHLPESDVETPARPVDEAVANILANAAAQPGDTRTIDDLVPDAVRVVADLGGVSVPALQRKLGIDFGTATELVARLESDGYVGSAAAGGKRKVLPKAYDRKPDPS